MGYEVHITRREQWTDCEENPILFEEWLANVDSDPEMRLDGFAEATTANGDVVCIEDDSIAVWTKWSKSGIDGSMAWFRWSIGKVNVCRPDKEILEKMRQIARHFNANVIGDDGERY